MEEQQEDDEAEVITARKDNSNVLFGWAYEDRFIDIIDSGDFESVVDINERLLQDTLKMPLEELWKLTKIHLQVDLSNSHLTHVGEILISLLHLNLNDSIVPSVWSLGTQFRNIQVLWIARSEVKELSGLCALDNLRELYCSYNEIERLVDFVYLDKLEVLDLEANRISKFDELNNLKSCFNLKYLTLEWNPVSNEKNYWKRVSRMLENLEFIDDYSVECLGNDPKNVVDIDKMKASNVDDQIDSIVHDFYFTLPYCIMDCNELFELAWDSLFHFQEEMSDDNLIVNAIKSSEYK